MEPSEPRTSGQPLEAARRMAEVVIERLVAPLVFAGHLDLDRAILLIKRGVVTALYSTGKSKALLASHVSKSERWFHRYLSEARQVLSGNGAADGDDDQSDISSGYRFMLELLSRLTWAYPEPLRLEQLREQMDISSWVLDDAALLARLELYEAMGLLALERDSHSELLIQARSDLLLNLPGDDRIEKIAERISWLPALLLSNFRGEGDFGGMVAELTPAALERARERLRQAFAEIMAEALVETNKSEDSTVTVRAVIAMGAVGDRDGQ